MFQSTHPHGVRLKQGQLTEEQAKFQSTHPHGVRRDFLTNLIFLSWFQSTHPHGVRHEIGLCTTLFFVVSIHAPTRGATNSGNSTKLRRRFQSTHPHGVRLIPFVMYKFFTGFNPRTHTGCDSKVCFTWSRCVRFNPRTHTGCDLHHMAAGGHHPQFQSTHPHGVRRR